MHSPFRLTRLASAFAVAAVLVAGAAAARPHGGAMFERLDADGNGSITAEEIASHKATMREGLDADGNGAVSFEEMQAHRERQREARARARFQRLDADGDGQVSLDEMDARGGKMLERLDADSDGEITREEFRAAHRRHGEGRRGHHGGKHDGG